MELRLWKWEVPVSNSSEHRFYKRGRTSWTDYWLYEGRQSECITLLTSKNDLSSVFFGGPGAGAAGVTDITSASSDNRIVSNCLITIGFRVQEALLFDNECTVSSTHITEASVLTLKILNDFVRLVMVFQLLWNVSCHSQAAMYKNQHLMKSALLLHNYIYIYICV